MHPFSRSASTERVLVCDGAMGTMLYAARRVHQQELRRAEPDAGRSWSRTCTRSTCAPAPTSSRPTPSAPTASSSASFGLADKLHDDQRRGRAASRGARPATAPTSPARSGRSASASSRGARPASTRRASTSASRRRRCVEGGVDLFILETFRDLNEIGAAIDAVRSLSDLPIVAQMTTEEDGNTLDGTPPERFAPELERRGATIIGVNCAVGPAPMLETIERMEAVTRAAAVGAAQRRQAARRRRAQHLSVLARVHGVVRPPVHPAQRAASSAAAAARRRSTSARSRRRFARRRAGAPAAGRLAAPGAGCAGARRDRSPRRRFRASRSRGSRSELARGTLRDRRRAAAAARLRGRAGHPARPRAQALRRRRRQHSRRPACRRAPERAVARACSIEQQAGIETLLHYSCRDRNLLGIQSDLLGAHAMGLRNLLLITGDPGRVGDYPDATAVFDVDSIGLTNVVSRLNHGQRRRRPADRRADRLPHRRVGEPGRHESRRRTPAVRVQGRGRRRVRADAADLRRLRDFERFLKRIEQARLPVIAGIFPFESARNAEFMANEVPGRPRARRAARADAARRRPGGAPRPKASRLPGRSPTGLRALVQGIQVSTQSGNIDAALAVARWTSLSGPDV